MTPKRQPAIFLGHGSPMEAIETDSYTLAVSALGRELPQPRAIIIASAHWTSPGPVRVSGSARPETIHDFYGFPDELHQKTYSAPGDPLLAQAVAQRLRKAGIDSVVDEGRGLDHGAWVPLSRLRPTADVPVIQVSVPRPSDERTMLRAGETLAPLRDDGILLVGSGNVVHNLRRAVFADKGSPAQAWAKEFDDWIWSAVLKNDLDSLLEYRSLGPNADAAVPDRDHFDPIFFALGSAAGDSPMAIHEGFHFGNLSMRSWVAGATFSKNSRPEAYER